MARLSRALALVLVVLLFAVACAASGPGKSYDSDENYSSAAPSDDAGESVTGGAVRHVIYEAWLTVTVKDVNTAVDQLAQRAAVVGGYISGSVRDNNPEQPSARITYRVPQAEYEGFLSFARSLGKEGRESIRSTDVTEEYVDLEARLASRQLHEERLVSMFARANTINELITIESELARVREEIERLQGRLRYLSENIAMSTIEVTLAQVQGETQIPGLGPIGLPETLRRALKALVNSSTLFLDILSFIIVTIFALLPFAIPVGLVVFLLLRRRRRSKNLES
jgi:hypothetical protein